MKIRRNTSDAKLVHRVSIATVIAQATITFLMTTVAIVTAFKKGS